MSLIEGISLDDKKAIVRVQIRQSVGDLWGYMKATFDQNMVRFWQNDMDLTPQEVADSLGTDATSLFMMAGMLKALLNAVKPGTANGETPMDVIPHEDGTVTIQPYPLPSSSSSGTSSSSSSSEEIVQDGSSSSSSSE